MDQDRSMGSSLCRYLQLVEEADGLTKIENLQSDSSDEIYLKVRLVVSGCLLYSPCL